MSETDLVHHGYYLLQIRTDHTTPAVMTGVLEDLRTGRRFPFDSLERLNALVRPSGPASPCPKE